MDKLMLLSGPRTVTGWVTVDSRPGADLVETIPPLPPAVTDRQWDRVELIHGIEHFYLWEARELLVDIRHILVPGGVLVLEQPNIEYAARVLLGQVSGRRLDQFAMWPLYGDPSHRSESMCHRWGYSPTTLAEELVRAGFQKDKMSFPPARHHVPDRDFRIEVVI